MLAALARREHSRAELQRKLQARGHAAADVAEVLDELVAARLQSDARYAQAYVRSRAERGYGPQRIALELKQRGASAEVIQQALHDAEHDWQAVAARADRKKFGAVADGTFETMARRRRYLEYRGFAADQIKAVLTGNEFDNDG